MTTLSEDDLTPLPDKLHWMCIHEDCENPKVGGTHYCHSHLKAIKKIAKQRTQAAEARKMQFEKQQIPRTPIKKVSDKRAEELKQYTPLRAKFIDEHPNCEARLGGCTGKTETIHHKSMSALDFLNVETWLGCCLICHIAIEAIPAEKRREMLFLVDVKERKTI